MSRTTVVKVKEEALLYAVVSSLPAKKFGCVQTVYITGTTTNTAENGDEYTDYPSVCASVDGYVVTKTPITTQLVLTVGGGTSITIPANTPPNRGFAIASADNLTGAIAITSGGVSGEVLEVVYVPQFTSGDRIDYVDSFSRSNPQLYRDIKDRGVLKHRKRIFNLEQTASGSLKFTNFAQGFNEIANQEFAACVERKDYGKATPTEYEYFGQAFLAEPNVNDTGDDSDTMSDFEFRYERYFTTEQIPS
jgi:hypothetical protein